MEKRFLHHATDMNFAEICKPFLWRKIQVVRLSVQLAKITDLSEMICGLWIQRRIEIEARYRETPWIMLVWHRCCNHVISSPLWRSLCSLSSNALRRKIFCFFFSHNARPSRHHVNEFYWQ